MQLLRIRSQRPCAHIRWRPSSAPSPATDTGDAQCVGEPVTCIPALRRRNAKGRPWRRSLRHLPIACFVRAEWCIVMYAGHTGLAACMDCDGRALARRRASPPKTDSDVFDWGSPPHQRQHWARLSHSLRRRVPPMRVDQFNGRNSDGDEPHRFIGP